MEGIPLAERSAWQVAGRQFCVLLVVVYAFVVIRSAWQCDDAYITYRVVDNFVNGYGLTWNVAERVQVYTHPLWMFLLSGVYYFTREIYYSSLFVSMGLSVVAVLIFAFGVARTHGQAILGLAILVLSKAFVDYSASGLENPLTYLLLTVFWYLYVRPAPDLRRFFLMALLAGLAAVNRMDSLVLYAPLLLGVFVRVCSWRAVLLGLLGFLPLLAWEVFAIIYYGFPLPNTAYAKVFTGVATGAVLQQGFFYLLNSVCNDPLTLTAITCAIVWACVAKRWRETFAAAALLLNLAYVVYVGGDFMGGRFLSVPLLLAVCMIASARVPVVRVAWRPLTVAVVLVGFVAPYPTLLTDINYGVDRKDKVDPRGITDERACYYPQTGLLLACRGKQMPAHGWAREGLRIRARGPAVTAFGAIGMRGYYAGPTRHIIDHYALGDPLMARMSFEWVARRWRVGHFKRELPIGYFESIAQRRNRILNRSLADFYDHLCTITRGPIFSRERFRTIYRMNTGAYTDLLVKYWTEPRHMPLAAVAGPVRDATAWDAPCATVLMPGGVLIDLGQPRHPQFVEVGLDHNDDYQIVYLRNGQALAEQDSPAQVRGSGGVHTRKLAVPVAVRTEGVEQVLVRPVRGDGRYSLGHIRLIGGDEVAQQG